MDLADVHTRLFFLANREQNFWPRADVDIALDLAQTWKFNDAYQKYAIDQNSIDDLDPFKRTYSFTESDTPNGQITLPNDPTDRYMHFLSLYTQYYDGSRIRTTLVDSVNEDKLGGRLNSQLEEVTRFAPIITFTSPAVIQLYPKVPNSGYAFYLSQPDAPHFIYTQVGRTVTYNQAGSTQLKWNETAINEIIIKALQFLGVNINSNQLLQFTEMKDKEKI